VAGDSEEEKAGQQTSGQEGPMKRTVKLEVERSSLMHVGRRVDYAVRALSYLAAQPQGRIVSRTEIERKQDIPSSFLSKIMKDLVAAGLVQSHVGCQGGFSLARPANTINIKQVYESVEGPLVLMQCLERDEFCPYDSVCTQISIWDRAQNLVAGYLSQVSIGDIADQKGLKERLSAIHG
jgi:Rrf2 family protein